MADLDERAFEKAVGALNRKRIFSPETAREVAREVLDAYFAAGGGNG